MMVAYLFVEIISIKVEHTTKHSARTALFRCPLDVAAVRVVPGNGGTGLLYCCFFSLLLLEFSNYPTFLNFMLLSLAGVTRTLAPACL